MTALFVSEAVIPVAGLGTRFSPITKSVPKELLPIVDRPIIEYLIEEAVASGIKKIIFITADHKDLIKDYFNPDTLTAKKYKEKGKGALLENIQNLSKQVEILYIDQGKPLGLGHAILAAKDAIESDHFAVMLGDEIIKNNGTPALAQCFENSKNEDNDSYVGVVQVPREDTYLYGVVDFESSEPTKGQPAKIKMLVEKPAPEEAPSNWILPGRYVFSKKIFEELEATAPDKNGEIQLTDAMKTLASKYPLYATILEGERHDTGDKLGFLKANILEALERDEIKDKLKKWLCTIDLNS